jgi:guanine nucleotide-binding protein subunit alpha
MGCCQSSEVLEEKHRNNAIESQIKRDKANLKRETKLLLLGKSDFDWCGV